MVKVNVTWQSEISTLLEKINIHIFVIYVAPVHHTKICIELLNRISHIKENIQTLSFQHSKENAFYGNWDIHKILTLLMIFYV